MSGACVLCGAIGPVDYHHVTGRAAPGASYFDPALTIPLCRACHATEHAGLRVLGLDFPRPGAYFTAHRLFRVAAHLNALADAGRGLLLDPGGTRSLAALILDAVPCADSIREGAA